MKRRSKEFSSKTKALIAERAEDLCEAMIPGVCHGNQALQYHHRKNRSQGGVGDVENGLLVCLWCHEYIGHNPAESYEHGWLVKSSYAPLDIAVVRRGVRVQLTVDGGVNGGSCY